MVWGGARGGGGVGKSVYALKLSIVPGTPLTHCNPEMKMREDGGDFIDFDCFKFFFDERMLI